MNPIDELRAARPAHLGDVPVDELTRAAELSQAMAGPRPARRRRGIVRPAWGLSLAGAAAAVTAVAVVVSGTGGTTPRAPAGTPSVASSVAQGSPGPQVRLSARDILLAAAEQADRQPDEPAAYWHTASVRRTLFQVEGGGYTVVDQERSEGWTPYAPGGKQWGRSQPLGVRPAGPDDEAAWRQAGSPEEVGVLVPGKKVPAKLSTTPGAVRTSHAGLVEGDKVFWLGRNVTMKDLRGLPSDPAALKAWLLRSYKGHGTESSSDPQTADAWLFDVTAGLITDMPVTPRVRGAAFRMLAGLDAVEVAEDVTDAEGRTGAAVTIDERTKAKATDKDFSGVLRKRLIFDRATGGALAYENVVVQPGGLFTDFAPGTVWNSNVVLEAGWTDDKPGS
ncbi:CU044_5270 family protein [Nonomuraea sp. NPDC005983]|uniref:CU044_5270 family protein n=1 Tax=Nonomuraea sp. NPDC005983 TaxID=3155595 RepID=UPI00339F8CEE